MSDRVLIFEARNGLGNRLRALYSCICLARHLDRKLLVRWDEFSRYWSNTDLDLISGGDYGRTGSGKLYFGLDFNIVNAHATLERIACDESSVVRISTGQMFKPAEVKLGDYLAGKTEFYRGLRPVPEISAATDRLFSDHFSGRKVLGLQIRQVDRKQYNEDVDLMLCYVNQIVSQYDLVFFTTDDASLLSVARERLPVEVICAHTERADATSDQMWVEGREPEQKIRDLVDFYLLSRCDLILHSSTSTFGYEAAFLGGADFFSIPTSTHVEYPRI